MNNIANYNVDKFSYEVDLITSNIAETLKKKNADYGNNVDKNIDEWGLMSLAIRLDDKLGRFKNLIKQDSSQQVLDEAIEDTLLDLAGYAILGYRKMTEMRDEKDLLPDVPVARPAVAPEGRVGYIEPLKEGVEIDSRDTSNWDSFFSQKLIGGYTYHPSLTNK